MTEKLRVGLIAPKNTATEKEWLLSFLGVGGESYQRGRLYDVVWFFNLTPEVKFIKNHTDSKVFAVTPEPKGMWPHNYDPELLQLCDYYLGYQNFAGAGFSGQFERFFFFADTRAEIEKQFNFSLSAQRSHDFCLFARHDPNIRSLVGHCLEGEDAILAGPLFNNPQKDKKSIQHSCRYEFITENEVNDYYFSEKIVQAMMCGCIPVYYGCRKIKDFIPQGAFIDLADFLKNNFEEGVGEAIRYCKNPVNYKKHFKALADHGLSCLHEIASIESCMTDPLNRYLDSLLSEDSRGKCRNIFSWLALKASALGF